VDNLPEPHRRAAPSHLNTATDVGLIWRINQCLWADERTKDNRIEVNAVEGRVRLLGVLPTGQARTAAIEIVRSVPGVRAVLSELLVSPPPHGAG
jgi:osmotically-inducible protein OsmY